MTYGELNVEEIWVNDLVSERQLMRVDGEKNDSVELNVEDEVPSPALK